MGNRLCKKKTDTVDTPNSVTQFDKIITRLHLRPSSWKSESQLNQNKQINNRLSKSGRKEPLNNATNPKNLSKSSDWTDVSLEVNDKDDHIHLRNPKLALIFNNDDGTPTPPPRKHKRGIREKIEAVAKNSLQALQMRKPVEEPLCIKKTIVYDCPCDHLIHNKNQNHNHHQHNDKDVKKDLFDAKNEEQNKEIKRRKNLSVVSLPNYSDLKLTVATFDDIDKKSNSEKATEISNVSFPGESKKSIGKNYMTRCRSFGSLLPQQLLGKLRPPSKKVNDIESDDSFGPLEDWDLGIIEHYNPRDASLPRPRKSLKLEHEILSDIEGLIVKEDNIPIPPVRSAESLLKRISKDSSESPRKFKSGLKNFSSGGNSNPNLTPPSTPEPRTENIPISFNASKLSNKEDGKVEHSSLMKILEEFSMRDKQQSILDDDLDQPLINNTFHKDDASKLQSIDSVESFIDAEKTNTDRDMKFTKYGNMGTIQT